MSLRSSVHGFESQLGLCFFATSCPYQTLLPLLLFFPYHFYFILFVIFSLSLILLTSYALSFHFSFRSGVFVLFVDSFATVLSLNCLFISYFDV